MGSLIQNNKTAVAPSDAVVGELETAGRLVDKHLSYDSNFPSLVEILKISQQGGPVVSGLNESDYPSSAGHHLLRHLYTVRKVPLPSDLLHHFQHLQCNCMMGLFPEIKRAWLTIDSDIYVWVYEDGSDLAYFDGLHDTILSAGLIMPKPGIFKPYIEYLLCLTTPSEIVLLGVSFSLPSEAEDAPGMHLLPEPLFSVPTDGSYILTIKGTKSGRILLGAKDGSLCELTYQAEDGWFSRKCQKVNHSRSSFSYFLPSFLSLVDEDPVLLVEVDESRHIAYTLSEKGTVSVYDLGSDGRSTARVISISQSSIVNAALLIAKTVDKANFKNLVSICPVDANESLHIHLVIFTGTGVRLYYTTAPLSSPHDRPSQLTLLHVRLPPGFSANAVTHRPTKVHKALYRQGTAMLCASESNESDVVWTVSGDQYPYHQTLAESQGVLSVDGYVWALADITPSLWCSSLEPPSQQGMRPPLLVTQHQQPPRQLVLLSASGAHILTTLRPVDQLRYLLQECGGPESSAVKEFFTSMTPIQACATALILATDPSLQTMQIANWAVLAMLRYGTTPSGVARQAHPQVQSQNVSFHPLQMSTPIPGQPQPAPIEVEPSFSPLHNALYLYLARILRPMWTTLLVKEQVIEGKSVLLSIIGSEQASFLVRHTELLAKFLSETDATSQPSLNTSVGQNLSMVNYLTDGSMNERSSLLALRALLSRSLEVLRLWTVLTTHNLSLVTSDISKDLKDQIRTVTLRDLIVNGKEICRQLILLLLNRYHGDNASVDAISSRLLEVCPSLFRAEDAKLSKANEIILTAKNCTNKLEKEKGFREAVALCKTIGSCLNVAGICAQLASGGFYEGVVDLCLSVANQRDPTGLALHYYKNNEPRDDHQGYLAFSSRLECYRVIVDQLYQLVGSISTSPPSIPTRPGPPLAPSTSAETSQYAAEMISLIVKSTDELAHVTLYQWLVDTNHVDKLLSITSPYLENYLTRMAGQNIHNQLLWKYYERNNDYYNAAKTLALLADEIGDTPLSVRLEYLSRALMCLVSCEMNTASSYAGFMLHLEEKKDVARIQLMALEAIQAQGVSGEVVVPLNSSLLDITTLYEKFAEPWKLYEVKLAIIHCAGHSEPHLVQMLWTNIIDSELNKSKANPLTARIDSLSNKIKALTNTYISSPNYFPLEHIIKECEIRSVKLKTDNVSWVVIVLQSCGLPIRKLLGIYHKLYHSNDSVWEIERAPFHLLCVLSNLMTILTDIPNSARPSERIALKEQCLDYVAEYLTDLGSSANPQAAIVASQLKTCQVRLERLT